MKLTVVIPCFNGEQTIGTQLEALSRQEWDQPWEIVVADNGSTDRSRDVILSFATRLPRLRLVDASDKRGAAHARNTGARHARGEFILFCDADDEAAPGWVAAMGNALAAHPFVAGAMEGAKLNPSWIVHTRTCQQGIMTLFYPPFLPHASSGNLGIRRSVHEAVGGFDESFRKAAGEDTDYCWRVQLAGYQLQPVPEAIIHYRYRNTLRGIYRQACAYGESCVYLYTRYRPLGMPPLSLREGIIHWLRLIKGLSRIRSRATLGTWLFNFGMRSGRLHGCIRYRTIAL